MGTTKRYGVSVSHYGGASFDLAETMRLLARQGVPQLEIRGCAYPEMARSEQVRQARAAGVGTVVFVDSHVAPSLHVLETLVGAAERYGMAAPSGGGDPWAPWALELMAVSRDVLEEMVEMEERRYGNSPSAVWGGNKVEAVPIASPWQRDGSPLVEGQYLTDSEAFMVRASQASGAVPVRVSVGMATRRVKRRLIRFRSVNESAPLTSEPGSRFALCIPSFGALDLDQIGSVYQLEKAGMTVFSIHDCPWIDQARSWLAEQALSVGKGAFFLDHDIVFEPNDVLRLCEQALERSAVVAGAYCMRRSGRNIIGSFDVKPGPMTFFEGGSTEPAYYSGLGFAAVPKEIFEAIELPFLTSLPLGEARIRPWFGLDCSTGFYAGEDVSFCNRVHDLTVNAEQIEGEAEWRMSHSGRMARVFIDSRVRIFHRGSYDYGIEDAGIVVPRIESLSALLTPSRQEARRILVNALEMPVDVRLDAMDFAEA